MIGFGELRRVAAQWQAEISSVERIYVIDWLLKGIFDHALLSRGFVLRGGSALRHAYCADYPLVQDPEFLVAQTPDALAWRGAMTDALRAAADASGLTFSLVELDQRSARVEYTGPLGRRSAAQPRITLALMRGQTRLLPMRLPLLHSFSDTCAATVSAVALEELAGERIAALASNPRARDVYDVWFVLTRARARLDAGRARALAGEIAQSKNVALPTAHAPFNPAQRAILERAWESALRGIRKHPSLGRVETDLAAALTDFGLD